MCVIIACLRGYPDDELLDIAQERNDDGIGIAWLATPTKPKKGGPESVVAWEKGIDRARLNTILEMLRSTEPHTSAIIHFRKQSIGPVGQPLCQPFPIIPLVPTLLSGEAEAVFFHNGTMNTWDTDLKAAVLGGALRGEPFPRGPWNDSRYFAFAAWAFGEGFLTFYSGGQRFATLRAGRSPAINRWGHGWEEMEKVGIATSCKVERITKVTDFRRPFSREEESVLDRHIKIGPIPEGARLLSEMDLIDVQAVLRREGLDAEGAEEKPCQCFVPLAN